MIPISKGNKSLSYACMPKNMNLSISSLANKNKGKNKKDEVGEEMNFVDDLCCESLP